MAERSEADTVQLKLRFKEPDRAYLEQAAAARGVSLNTEIVDRLRRTFVEDEKISDMFGSRRSFALFRLMAATAASIEEHEAQAGESWTDSADLYARVVQAVGVVLETFKPPGEQPHVQSKLGRTSAEQTLARLPRTTSASLAKAGERLPDMQEGPRIKTELGRAQAGLIIVSDLGPLADRLPPQKGRRS